MSKSKNQLWMFDPDADYAKKKVVIVWVWGVWSVAAYYISQMWCSDITIIDMDEVEVHNTASQFYKQSDLRRTKVDALSENISVFNWVTCKTFNEPYNSKHIEWADIVVAAVDNMDVRKQIVDDAYDLDVPYVIEARMSWEEFMIYCFDPFTMKDTWMAFRYPQSEVEPVVCTMKSISYNTWVIWSLIAKLVKNILRWERYPFFISFDMSTFTFSSDY